MFLFISTLSFSISTEADLGEKEKEDVDEIGKGDRSHCYPSRISCFLHKNVCGVSLVWPWRQGILNRSWYLSVRAVAHCHRLSDQVVNVEHEGRNGTGHLWELIGMCRGEWGGIWEKEKEKKRKASKEGGWEGKYLNKPKCELEGRCVGCCHLVNHLGKF